MAGLKVVTDLQPDKALRSAWRAAQEQGFSLTSAGLDVPRFEARKGHVIISHFLGPLAPYRHFNVSVEPEARGSAVILDKTLPWITTGLVGVGRVHRHADDLMDAIVAAIEHDGGSVLERKDF